MSFYALILSCIFGIFAKNDELFSHIDTFKEFYGKTNAEMLHYDLVEGNHRLTKDELEMPLVKAVSYFKNLTQYSNLKENKLNEHFINIFKKDENLLQKYGQKVYDMLKEAYKPIGGLLGCESYEELIKDPNMMWKLKTEAGKILAVFIYSFKKGERKLQYCTCEKSDEGRSSFMQIMEDDKKFLERMFWGEISGAVENYYVTKVGMSMIPNIFVKSLLPDKKDIELDSDGFHYTRNIGGKKEKKVIVGDTGNIENIKSDAKIKKLNLNL